MGISIKARTSLRAFSSPSITATVLLLVRVSPRISFRESIIIGVVKMMRKKASEREVTFRFLITINPPRNGMVEVDILR